MLKFFLIAMLTIALSCELPTSPKRDCAGESACTVTVAKGLTKDQEIEAIDKGRVQAALKAELLPVCTAVRPKVEYVPCPFYMKNAWDGVKAGPACAGGMTDYPNGILVSTHQPENTAALVTWESENWYWMCAGRFDLTR